MRLRLRHLSTFLRNLNGRSSRLIAWNVRFNDRLQNILMQITRVTKEHWQVVILNDVLNPFWKPIRIFFQLDCVNVVQKISNKWILLRWSRYWIFSDMTYDFQELLENKFEWIIFFKEIEKIVDQKKIFQLHFKTQKRTHIKLLNITK